MRDGRLLITDRSERIRVFDKDGKFVRSIGRGGPGPGEFRSIDGLALLPGDTLLALDGVLRRLNRFDSAGTHIASVRMEPTGSPEHPLDMYRLAGVVDQSLILVARAYPADMKPVEQTHWDSVPNLVYTMSDVWSGPSARRREWISTLRPLEQGLCCLVG